MNEIIKNATYYEELINWVQHGHACRINLKEKSMWLTNNPCINKGNYHPDVRLIDLLGIEECKNTNEYCLNIIEELYHNYKYSTPSEQSEKNKQKTYFKALSSNEMTDEELIIGESRELAKAKLEGFILCASLAGYLTWDEKTMGKWFYQGKDKDLVILREWIEREWIEERGIDNMNKWNTNGLPPVGKLVEILMYSGNIRKDMIIKSKYGTYEWKTYVDKYVSAWRYIEEDADNKCDLNNANKKENKTMMKNTRENRVATMQAAGLDTKKYFSVNFPEGLNPGASISIIVNNNGSVTINGNENDIDNYNVIAEGIQNGYVRNTKLHRRWVMAQMFRMLNYRESWNANHVGYNYYLNNMYDYKYQFKMLVDELNVLAHLEKEDKETFEERTRFFNKDVVVALCNDYYKKLRKYVSTCKIKRCKGKPYVSIGSQNVFVEYLKVVYDSILEDIEYIKKSKSYENIHYHLKRFVYDYVEVYRLPYNTPKCAEWKDAYKGTGAYYTMMNMTKFHNCFVIDEDGIELKGMAAVRYIDSESRKNVGKGYRLFAMMNKMIEDNNFNFNNRMK